MLDGAEALTSSLLPAAVRGNLCACIFGCTLGPRHCGADSAVGSSLAALKRCDCAGVVRADAPGEDLTSVLYTVFDYIEVRAAFQTWGI